MSIWAFLFSVRQIYFRVVREIGARFAPTIWPLFFADRRPFRSHGVNFFVEDEKRGLSLCPLQGRFLFDRVKKQKAFSLCKEKQKRPFSEC